MDSLPPMRPLVMVLKVFLQQRELNEVRQSPPYYMYVYVYTHIYIGFYP